MHGTQIVLPRLLCPTTCHPPLEPTAMLLRLGVVEIDDDGEFDLILFTHDERGRRAAASAMRNAVFPLRFSHLGAHPDDLESQRQEVRAVFTPVTGRSPSTKGLSPIRRAIPIRGWIWYRFVSQKGGFSRRMTPKTDGLGRAGRR